VTLFVSTLRSDRFLVVTAVAMPVPSLRLAGEDCFGVGLYLLRHGLIGHFLPHSRFGAEERLCHLNMVARTVVLVVVVVGRSLLGVTPFKFVFPAAAKELRVVRFTEAVIKVLCVSSGERTV